MKKIVSIFIAVFLVAPFFGCKKETPVMPSTEEIQALELDAAIWGAIAYSEIQHAEDVIYVKPGKVEFTALIEAKNEDESLMYFYKVCEYLQHREDVTQIVAQYFPYNKKLEITYGYMGMLAIDMQTFKGFNNFEDFRDFIVLDSLYEKGGFVPD